MEQIIKNSKLTQLIDNPTRATSHFATLIDIIFTNSPALALHHDEIAFPMAGHEFTSVTLNIAKPKRHPKIKTFRQLNSTHQKYYAIC